MASDRKFATETDLIDAGFTGIAVGSGQILRWCRLT